jgi:hypothetical protein
MARIYKQLSHASGYWAAYYDPGQDALTFDSIVAWGLVEDEAGSRIVGLSLDRETDTLVPASEYANFVATVNNADLKTIKDKLLERGREMKGWLTGD